MAVKITPAQREVLEELAKPEAVAHYMPSMGWLCPKDYWYLSTTHKKVRKGGIEKLEKMGLVVSIRESTFSELYAKITPAGREAIGEGE